MLLLASDKRPDGRGSAKYPCLILRPSPPPPPWPLAALRYIIYITYLDATLQQRRATRRANEQARVQQEERNAHQASEH
jgi:hypothetical protein